MRFICDYERELHSVSVNYGSVYLMPHHLKAGDGDLLLITELYRTVKITDEMSMTIACSKILCSPTCDVPYNALYNVINNCNRS